MPHVLSELFEDQHVGDPNFAVEYELSVIDDGLGEMPNFSDDEDDKVNQNLYPLTATIHWVNDQKHGLYLKATVEEYDAEKHGTPETYQASKKALFQEFQSYMASYGISLTHPSLENTENTFDFNLMPFKDYKTKPKETRTTLQQILAENHPYLQLNNKLSLLAFAEKQTPTVSSILRSPVAAGRQDKIYQTAMDQQKTNIKNNKTQQDTSIHTFLSLLSKYSNTQNMLYELEIINKGKENIIFQDVIAELISIDNPSLSKINKVMENYKNILNDDEIILLQYLAKLHQKWDSIQNAMTENDEIKEKLNIATIANGIINSSAEDFSFIDALLQLDDAIKEYLGIQVKDREALIEYFYVSAFGIEDYENKGLFMYDDVKLDQVNFEQLIESSKRQKAIIRKINNYFLENDYPGSEYFADALEKEEREEIPPSFSITAKPTIEQDNKLLLEKIKIPAYIRQYLVNRLAYDMNQLTMGVGSSAFHLKKGLLPENDEDHHTYTYEWNNEFEPIIYITEGMLQNLYKNFEEKYSEHDTSFTLIGETDAPLMKETCLRSIFDFYDEVTQSAMGVLQPDTDKYYAATVTYQHTEDEAHHINRVEVTVTDKQKKLPGRVESFAIEGKRMASRGKNRITYAVMAESFKEAGAKRVKIRVDLKDIEDNPHLKEGKLHDAALKRMTIFAEELIKRGMDFSVGDLPERFGSIKREDVVAQLSEDLQKQWAENARGNLHIDIKKGMGE